MRQRLTEEIINSTVDKIVEKYREYGDLYKKGLITKDECFLKMQLCFYDNYSLFIKENKLKLNITARNFSQFIEEFKEYQSGNIRNDSKHQLWLYDISRDKEEATLNDQMLFFDFMEKLHITPIFFEPPPENLPCMNIKQHHVYAFQGVYGTQFNCVDDGGLLNDKNPIGKTYRIRNNQGLEAVLTIVEEKHNDNINNQKNKELVANGYIKGYTAIERTANPEIRISIDDINRPWYLTFWMDSKDTLAYNKHPLWEEMRHWSDAKKAKNDLMFSSFFESFIV